MKQIKRIKPGDKVLTCDGVKNVWSIDGISDILTNRVYMIEDKISDGYSKFYIEGQVELIENN